MPPNETEINRRMSASGECADDGGSRIRRLMELVRHNRCVLVTGKAGTGKSTLLKKAVAILRGRGLTVAVTAPTGVAAINCGQDATTVHCWMSMGLMEGSIGAFVRRLSRRAIKNLRKTDVLVIDEVSMLSADLFEKIAAAAAHVTGGPSGPGLFGRMTVIMFGDFMQLPPVIDRRRRAATNAPTFVFQSRIWDRLKVARMNLTRVWRQPSSQSLFLKVMSDVRRGELDEEDVRALKSRCVGGGPPAMATHLCSYRSDAEEENERQLLKLDPSTAITYTAVGSVKAKNRFVPVDPADRAAAERALAGNALKVPRELEIRQGAQVMLRKNMLDRGLCNGSQGTVVSAAKEEVVVRFENGSLETIRPHVFQQEFTSAVLHYRQMPLMLAYALTIHKSQGMTLSKVYMDTCQFAPGQFYVAISRARRLEDVYLNNWRPEAVMVDKDCAAFSRALEAEAEEVGEEEEEEQEEDQVVGLDFLEKFRYTPRARSSTASEPVTPPTSAA